MKTSICKVIHQMGGNILGLPTQLKRIQKAIQKDIEESKMLAAKFLINQMKLEGVYENIQDAEFKVFSQWGDDGIIQYLVHQLKLKFEKFVEFGVQNYRESNTRFLLMNNNWEGLVIEGDKKCIDFIIRDYIYWRYALKAVHAFINKDNINKILKENHFSDEIGLLSIDIDGNDYWIWNAVHEVEPIIVIIEYNGLFGDQHSITVPYDPQFIRTQAHYSNLYWGTSLKALCLLAAKKGYEFVGSNSNGNNAYFVRKDKIGKLRTLSVKQGYMKAKYRESRDQDGKLTYLSNDECIEVIGDMPVYDVEADIIFKIKELFRNRS